MIHVASALVKPTQKSGLIYLDLDYCESSKGNPAALGLSLKAEWVSHVTVSIINNEVTELCAARGTAKVKSQTSSRV